MNQNRSKHQYATFVTVQGLAKQQLFPKHRYRSTKSVKSKHGKKLFYLFCDNYNNFFTKLNIC